MKILEIVVQGRVNLRNDVYYACELNILAETVHGIQLAAYFELMKVHKARIELNGTGQIN